MTPAPGISELCDALQRCFPRTVGETPSDSALHEAIRILGALRGMTSKASIHLLIDQTVSLTDKCIAATGPKERKELCDEACNSAYRVTTWMTQDP